jgi:hypothetical protein
LDQEAAGAAALLAPAVELVELVAAALEPEEESPVEFDVLPAVSALAAAAVSLEAVPERESVR